MNDLVPIIAGAPPFHRPLQRRGIHAELLLRQLALLLRHRNPIGAISFHHTALVSPVSRPHCTPPTPYARRKLYSRDYQCTQELAFIVE